MLATFSDQPITLTVLRKGEEKTFTLQPVLLEKRYRIGIGTMQMKVKTLPFAEAMKLSLHENRQYALLILELVKKMAQRKISMRSIEGPIHTTNYAEVRARALRVSQRLERDGIKLGDRVATLAWNTWRHLEAWYGIMGIGAVYHTVNPRLFPDQISWIVNHAEDRVMMTDITFVPLLEKLADKLR